MAAPTATHHGRKKTTRETRERLGGVHGAPGGAGARGLDSDAEWAAGAGLAGADGSVSCVLRLLGERTFCNARIYCDE